MNIAEIESLKDLGETPCDADTGQARVGGNSRLHNPLKSDLPPKGGEVRSSGIATTTLFGDGDESCILSFRKRLFRLTIDFNRERCE